MGIDLELIRKPPRELVVELTRLKFVRYSTASAVAVVVSQVALVIFNAGLGWSGVRANLMSVVIASIPNYLINRHWTWQQTGPNRLWTEIVPFWVMALLGTILSTLAVDYADGRWGTPLAVGIAQLSGFGVLWVARFVILDKVMWQVVHDLHPEVADEEVATRTNGDGDDHNAVPTSSGTPFTAEAPSPNGADGNGARPDTVDPATASDRSRHLHP